MNLPIAERELRVAARSPRVYRGRMVACFLFGVVTLWMLWVMRRAFFNSAVEMSFTFVSSMALMMCAFACTATADSISSEKRGGTLGFLFLTDLKGADVVFGKFVAFGLMAMYALLAIIPTLTIPVLMGGIPGASIIRTAVTLINTMFAALAFGLWISARSWDQKKANMATVWTAISFLWLVPGLAALVEQRFHWDALATALRVLSPMYQLQKAGPFGIGMLRDQYWLSVAILHALAWLAIWRACRIVPQQWQDRPQSVAVGIRERWNQLKIGPRELREKFRREKLDLNPIHWLSARDRFGALGNWFLLGMVFCIWTGMWIWISAASRGKGPPFWAVGIPMVFLTTVILRVKTAAVSSDLLARDRLSGALELLLSTSLSLKQLTAGIWMTVRRFLLGPILVTIATGFLIFLCAINEVSIDLGDSEMEAAYLVFFGLSVLFVTDLIAAVWTGLWMSCVIRTPTTGGGMAMLRLMLLPWLFFFATVSIMSYFGIRNFFQEFRNVFILWFSFCFLNNLFWMQRSKRKFYEEVRTAASERFLEESVGWWKFWKWGGAARG